MSTSVYMIGINMSCGCAGMQVTNNYYNYSLLWKDVRRSYLLVINKSCGYAGMSAHDQVI